MINLKTIDDEVKNKQQVTQNRKIISLKATYDQPIITRLILKYNIRKTC